MIQAIIPLSNMIHQTQKYKITLNILIFGEKLASFRPKNRVFILRKPDFIFGGK